MSDFLDMRRRQLHCIELTYFLQNLLILVEFCLYFLNKNWFTLNETWMFEFGSCTSTWYSFALFVELLPIQLLLIAFWYIPRRFLMSIHEINSHSSFISISSELQTSPLLEDRIVEREEFDFKKPFRKMTTNRISQFQD